MKNRLIYKIVTESQISVTITDQQAFDSEFEQFKSQSPYNRPQRRHFLAALAHRFYRGEIEGQKGNGYNIYIETPTTKTASRFGENIEF